MNSMEAYVQFTPGLITDDGTVTQPSTEAFLRKYLETYEDFVARVLTILPSTS
jgi:chromate reductase, NAD(P)H dehydrogenase (quinone)